MALRMHQRVTGSKGTCGRAAARPTLRRCVRPVRAVDQEAEIGTAPPANVCATCGVDLSNAPSGCDRNGRVIGGMGALPGFQWWPIKAYKPCPALTSAGMDYVRKGQATNEMLFGGVSLSSESRKTLQEIKRQQDKGLDVEL